MKSLLLLPILGLVFLASSCRTVTPIDPMTMKQSEKCLPNDQGCGSDCCRQVHAAK